MDNFFDELFKRISEYDEAIKAEPPISIHGPINTKKGVAEWEMKQAEHIEECKGRAIDALNDYIDKRIERYHSK